MLRNIKCLIKDIAPSMSYSKNKLWKQTILVYVQKLNLSCQISMRLHSTPFSHNCKSLISQQRCNTHRIDHKNIHFEIQRHRNNIKFVNELKTRHRGIFTVQGCSYSTNSEDLINPIDKLQIYVDAPIIPSEDHLFNPSLREVKDAGRYWTNCMKKMKFLKSVKFHDQLPEDSVAEVTFIGRSNVGKSSLIQSLLLKSTVDVYISKTPGHTRLLNFFEVKDQFRLVDVPGYGYRMPEDYPELVEGFLKNRPRLCRTFLLLDGTAAITDTDLIGIEMVEEFQIPYVFVITKIDKVKPSMLLQNLSRIQNVMKGTRYCFPQPFLVSSMNGEGIPLLQTFISYVTGNKAIEGI